MALTPNDLALHGGDAYARDNWGQSGLGLTAEDLGSMTRLTQLACNPQSVPRGDIYLAVASLYQSQCMRLSERERSLMREILQRLTADVEMAIRIALAERLADDDTAPLDLILLLADDHIEVARPLILRSRQLNDADLLSLLGRIDEEHQVACAARPHIGEPVCDALAKSNSESVLVTLIRNATARIGAFAFETLVEKSRQIAVLRGPLVQRNDLPGPLATRMCDWVSDALKSHIEQNFPLAPACVESDVDQAAKSIQNPPAPPGDAAASSAHKLVAKLSAAGQLRAGFLLRVLHQGQLDLFEIAFATLLGLDIPCTHRVLYQNGAADVALACRAVGIDRCVFSTVFNLSRQARRMHPSLTAAEKAEVEAVFANFSKVQAQCQLRALTTPPEGP